MLRITTPTTATQSTAIRRGKAKRLASVGAMSLAISVALSGCFGESADAQWDSMQERFIEGYFEHNPSYAVYQGKHEEYDGQLPDWSAEGLAAHIAFLEQSIAEAEAIDGLSKADAFERDYMVATAAGQLFFLKDANFPAKNPAFYVGTLDPNVYVARPYADAKVRMEAFIKYLRAVPTAAEQIKANLQLPLPATYVKYGVAGFNGFAGYYTSDAKAAFAVVDDEELQREFDEAAAVAAESMRSVAAYIESQPGTSDGYALGAELYAKMLRDVEAVDISLAELEAIGEADLKRNRDALQEACSRYAPGASVPDCMAKMSADKPANGPVAEARAQLPALREFLVVQDLVSIPGTEEALVEESPPYNRQNSAYIDIPGPYEQGLPSVYYITPPDPAWDAATRASFVPSKKDLLFISVHEIWPGHFLQFLHSNRSDSIFGKLFVGYGFAEGWAHYTEELMWEAGLGDGDAETHIGQLSNALLRNCRYLSAIRLHARGMSVEQSRDMFMQQCYQGRGTALQQAARGTYDPLYLNYTMGKLMIRKLREDWTGGDRGKWKDFHDSFLSYGGPPIPMVRAAMMNEAEPQAKF